MGLKVSGLVTSWANRPTTTQSARGIGVVRFVTSRERRYAEKYKRKSMKNQLLKENIIMKKMFIIIGKEKLIVSVG